MTLTVSPLAPASFPTLPHVAGVSLGTAAAGIRKGGRDDLLVAVFAPGTAVAGTLTKSLCPAAPIDWCRRVLDEGDGTAGALICNSGNANAFTGKSGAVSTELMADSVAAATGVEAGRVLVASTGLIGEPMPDDKVASAVPALVARLAPSSPSLWEAAAGAIRTTDTFAKGAAAAVPGTEGTIAGIAKGSGMIAPDMATMLGFVFTDLPIAPGLLQLAITASVDRSFNRITVDSDTSTNDAVLVFATGQSGDQAISSTDDPRFPSFQATLDGVTLDLAKQIAGDGEGATKLVAVNVTGATSEISALKIARSVAESPLVKTALAAGDANWGRIVMAVGKAGEPADRDKLSIWIGPELVALSGTVWQEYDEGAATAHLEGDEVEITVDVGVGEHRATVWTCDLTHGYVEINAGYRT